MDTVRCQRTMTVAAANAVAVASARRSPIREPAPAEPQSMTTVPASATPIATQVRRRTRSPRQSHPRSPAMNGERLWMTSVLATDVRDSAMMKHVDAAAKHAAMSEARPSRLANHLGEAAALRDDHHDREKRRRRTRSARRWWSTRRSRRDG